MLSAGSREVCVWRVWGRVCMDSATCCLVVPPPLQMVAKGKDCAALFPAVVKNVVSSNPEVQPHTRLPSPPAFSFLGCFPDLSLPTGSFPLSLKLHCAVLSVGVRSWYSSSLCKEDSLPLYSPSMRHANHCASQMSRMPHIIIGGGGF